MSISPEQRRGRILATVAGALLPLYFAPFSLGYLAPVSIALLFWAWHSVSPVEAAWRGGLFGLAAFAAGTWWLYVSIHIMGDAPVALAVFLMVALFLIMATYYAVCGYVVNRWVSAEGSVRYLIALPAAWVLFEWLRGWLFSGFPWLSMGYTQTDTVFGIWAPVGGVYGLSLLVALVAGLLTWAVLERSARIAAGLALAAIGAATAGMQGYQWTRPAAEPMVISMVQGAVPQELKWLPSQREPTVRLYTDYTIELEDSELVIWPEAAIPLLDVQVTDYLDSLAELMSARGGQLLTGIVSLDRETDEYRNTLINLGDERSRYIKRHLVPFGEYFPVPDFVRSWMRLMSLPFENTVEGPRDQDPLYVNGIALAPSICYEDAFGNETIDFLPEAGLLVNVSNDAWFGDTIAPHQHLQMARMRSMETGRYMLRSTNTGITAVIGPDGALLSTLPQFEPGVLTDTVWPHVGATPYVHTGNWLVVIWGALGLLAGGVLRRR